MKRSIVAIQSNVTYEKSSISNAFNSAFNILGDFSAFIKPGMKVFIKPNWVASKWRDSCQHKDDIYSVITHPAVIEETADRVAKALNGSGEITIGDNPSIDAYFEELMGLQNICHLENKYDVPCKILDLRPLVCEDLKYYGNKDLMSERMGDPKGEATINMGKRSLFYGLNNSLFHGVFEQREQTRLSHTGENHLYTFSRSIYDSNVYISIPKMKTHHKTGVTLNLKGLVGTISQKNQLIHWQDGYPEVGGDEYPNKESYFHSKNQEVTKRGAWYGNDTIWRMVVDIYNAFLTKKRLYFTVIDGIMSGEGEGPFCPVSKNTNTLIFSDDLLYADIVTTRLMGLKYNRIKYLDYICSQVEFKEKQIEIFKDKEYMIDFFDHCHQYFDFNVTENWRQIKI